MENLVSFYRGRRVFVTGHTGFKGGWLCLALTALGAEVTGYALPSPTEPSLYALAGLGARIRRSILGDVRDRAALAEAVAEAKPEIVFHLAAQPIVLEGYRHPADTYETNVMGTVNLLEAARLCPSVRSIVNVTTDKVYRNDERTTGYREDDVLDGYDPYSGSKSCSELVTAVYRRSFFEAAGVAVSTARAGNVIGGGDFAPDRILPDCFRAAEAGKPIRLRNPGAVRPFQHVLEPIFAYLLLAMHQTEDPALAGSYNIGPADRDCVTAAELAGLFREAWGEVSIEHPPYEGPHEAGLLRLDCSLIRERLGWQPRLDVREAVALAVRWERARLAGADPAAETLRQIKTYLSSITDTPAGV